MFRSSIYNLAFQVHFDDYWWMFIIVKFYSQHITVRFEHLIKGTYNHAQKFELRYWTELFSNQQ